MSAHRDDLTPDQRRLLQIVFDVFRETGNWPNYLFVERKLDSALGADLLEVGRPILGDLIMFDPYRSPASEVLLPISGIAYCEGKQRGAEGFPGDLALARCMPAGLAAGVPQRGHAAERGKSAGASRSETRGNLS